MQTLKATESQNVSICLAYHPYPLGYRVAAETPPIHTIFQLERREMRRDKGELILVYLMPSSESISWEFYHWFLLSFLTSFLTNNDNHCFGFWHIVSPNKIRVYH